VIKAKVQITDNDRGWTALNRRAKKAKDGRVKVGVLANDAKGNQDHGGLTVAELAAILHYGTDEIAARPYLAMAFDKIREELSKMGGELLTKVLTGQIPLDQALGLLGLKLSTEAKKIITEGRQLAPNAPSTIARKGSDRPLVDTARLLNANTWAIDKGAK
jgi:hypothetical protein